MKVSMEQIDKPLNVSLDAILENYSPEKNKGLSIVVQNNIENLFKEKDPLPDHVFVLLSGTSESGKSHFGEHFLEKEAGNKIKFYKLLRLTSGYSPWSITVKNPDPFLYAEYLASKPEEQADAFSQVLDQIEEIEEQTRCTVSSMETIKHPWIVNAFRSLDNTTLLSVFVDAPLKVRIERESLKTGLSLEEIEKRTILKDSEKDNFGNEEVRKTADIVINNGGTVEEYNNFIQSLEKELEKFANKEHSIPIDNNKVETGQVLPKELESVSLEDGIKHKYGLLVIKPDAIDYGIEDIIADHVSMELRKKGIYLIGSTVLEQLNREQVGTIYPTIDNGYFEAYVRLYGKREQVLLFFESKNSNIDVWGELFKIRGKIKKGHGLQDSVRAIVPLPGTSDIFDEISKRISSNEMRPEDYDNAALNLAHVPENISEFSGLLHIADRHEVQKIFGKKRGSNLLEITKESVQNRK